MADKIQKAYQASKSIYDDVLTQGNHGVLHRDYTLATGGSICDYWIVPDKIRNPQ